jgi:ABC-type lipoprotein release transport system permease subunit
MLRFFIRRLLLAVVTFLSSLVPALKAANVDPISSLRAE